eukprot:355313_1
MVSTHSISNQEELTEEAIKPFTVCDAVEDVCDNSMNSCVWLSPTAMHELNLSRGDMIRIKGNEDQSTICRAFIKEMNDHKIMMNETTRINLHVEADDVVSVTCQNQMYYGTHIHVRPFETIDSVSESKLNAYLKPYFFPNHYRPIKEGDYFIIHGKHGKRCEFEVIKVTIESVPNEDACIVAPETIIYCNGYSIKCDQNKKKMSCAIL